ncbi:MAG: TraB/GumN family protein [Oscillospiraceae bacterium]|nr:TraB/GumN family protein [Oscillospiraceae bacterium]
MKSGTFKRLFSFILALTLFISASATALASDPTAELDSEAPVAVDSAPADVDPQPLAVDSTAPAAVDSQPTVVDSAPPQVEITDIYSSWAEEDVFMAQDVYNLGNAGTYSNFLGDLTVAKFMPVLESLAAALKSDIDFQPADDNVLLTRGEVVTILYGVLTGINTEDDYESLEYFIDAGLIYGRSPDDYQLLEICTVEEMIALSNRVYNHGIYEAGNYSTGFFWEVDGVSNKVYLLGSIHLSDYSIYPMSKPIEVAFARSDNLVVEADISDMGEDAIAFITKIGFYDPTSGETIADYISEETYAQYIEVFESLGIPEDVYSTFKPWMAYNYLTSLLMSEGDQQTLIDNTGSGIDMYFLLKAGDAEKNILQLESIESQITMMSSFSDELQEMLLSEVLSVALGSDEEDESEEEEQAQAEDLSTLLQEALKAMKTGDEAAIIELFGIDAETDDPLSIEYNQKMMTERDAAMAEKIAGYLEEETNSGDYFIVVGAAHLLSKKSVIAQLSDMGYEVERIK